MWLWGFLANVSGERLQVSFLSFRVSRAWSLLAQLRCGGRRPPSLFPPLQSFGGPGAPPPAAAEVSTGLPPVTPEKTPAAAMTLVSQFKVTGGTPH